MTSVLGQNRQTILFADRNLNINTKGWKSEFVPLEREKSVGMILEDPRTESLCHEAAEVHSPVEAKFMPPRSKVNIQEAELICKDEPFSSSQSQIIEIPIQRGQEVINDHNFNNSRIIMPEEKDFIHQNNDNNNTIHHVTQNNLPIKTKPEERPIEKLVKNEFDQRVEVPKKLGSIWNQAPRQPMKVCKKPQSQAEWDAILNANLAGMAQNEEEFTREFMANLMTRGAHPTNGNQTLPSPKRPGSYYQSNQRRLRSVTPPGLRSVPKSPACWACGEIVEPGIKVLKVKGYPMHLECFVCNTCYVPLKTTNVFISNDRLFCREHVKFGSRSIRSVSRGPTPRGSRGPTPEMTEF